MNIEFWQQCKGEAEQLVHNESLLSSYVDTCILAPYNFKTVLSDELLYVTTAAISTNIMGKVTCQIPWDKMFQKVKFFPYSNDSYIFVT